MRLVFRWLGALALVFAVLAASDMLQYAYAKLQES